MTHSGFFGRSLPIAPGGLRLAPSTALTTAPTAPTMSLVDSGVVYATPSAPAGRPAPWAPPPAPTAEHAAAMDEVLTARGGGSLETDQAYIDLDAPRRSSSTPTADAPAPSGGTVVNGGAAIPNGGHVPPPRTWALSDVGSWPWWMWAGVAGAVVGGYLLLRR